MLYLLAVVRQKRYIHPYTGVINISKDDLNSL